MFREMAFDLGAKVHTVDGKAGAQEGKVCWVWHDWGALRDEKTRWKPC